MVGTSLALAAGLHRPYGRRITAMAAVAAAHPDWDTLSILFGAQAYTRVHRVWGHNLLVAIISGSAAGLMEYLYGPLDRVYQRAVGWLLRHGWTLQTPPATAPQRSFLESLVWTATGAIASLSYLLVDVFYSGGRELRPWPLPSLWPFSKRSWTYPLVQWGEFGATLIFVAAMFLLYYRPNKSRLIALGTLLFVSLYIAAHA